MILKKLKLIWIWIKNFWPVPLLLFGIFCAIIFWPKSIKKFDDLIEQREAEYTKEKELHERLKREKTRKIEVVEENFKKEKEELKKEKEEKQKKTLEDRNKNLERNLDDYSQNKKSFVQKIAERWGFDYEP